MKKRNKNECKVSTFRIMTSTDKIGNGTLHNVSPYEYKFYLCWLQVQLRWNLLFFVWKVRDYKNISRTLAKLSLYFTNK